MAKTFTEPVVSDDELLRLSERNPGYRIERDDDGVVTVSPSHTETGPKNGEAIGQLWQFAKTAGGKAYDSDTGFKTPRGGILAPDASWISAERLTSLTPQQRTKYWRVTPDVVIEVMSGTDSWSKLQKKIDRFFEDGAAYAVAIHPDKRDVYERGTPPPGLELDFNAILDA